MNLKCICGSKNFKADYATITLIGLPCTINTKDGPQYTDSEADFSEGWDWDQDDAITCMNCGKHYVITADHNGEAAIDPVEVGWLEKLKQADHDDAVTMVAEAIYSVMDEEELDKDGKDNGKSEIVNIKGREAKIAYLMGDRKRADK